MRQEVFALAEGDITIQWPERISADSLQDFNDWLVILKRKITRSVIPAESPKTPSSAAPDDKSFIREVFPWMLPLNQFIYF